MAPAPSLIRAELHLKASALPSLPAWFPGLVPVGWPEEWPWASRVEETITGIGALPTPPGLVQLMQNKGAGGWHYSLTTPPGNSV